MDQLVKFVVGETSDIGQKRSLNEDSTLVHIPKDPKQLKGRGALFIVADGMGRYGGGAVAADSAISKIKEQYYYSDSTQSSSLVIRTSVEEANRQTYEYAQKNTQFEGMGTTLVGAVIYPHGGMRIFNVGDSRAYLIRDNKIRQLSTDHSVVAERIKNEDITWEEAVSRGGVNRVTRSLGRHPNVDVELAVEEQLQPGDLVVLCSDGLWGYIDDEKIKTVVLKSKSPQEASDRLVSMANEAGGKDNITIVLVKIEATSTVTPESVVPRVQPRRRTGRALIWLATITGIVAIGLVLLSLFSSPASTPVETATRDSQGSQTLTFSTVASTASATAESRSSATTAARNNLLQVPELDASLSGARFNQNDEVMLIWTSAIGLTGDQTYQVWITYQDATGRSVEKILPDIKDTQIILPSEMFFQDGRPVAENGKYSWSVGIVEGTPGPDQTELSPRTTEFVFFWIFLPPTPTATFTPIPITETPTLTPPPECPEGQFWDPALTRCRQQSAPPSATEPPPIED